MRVGEPHRPRRANADGAKLARGEAVALLDLATPLGHGNFASREELIEWVDARGVLLRGGGLDEAPQAYRRLPEDLAAQGATVRVLHTLIPLIVAMASSDEFDPYKD